MRGGRNFYQRAALRARWSGGAICTRCNQLIEAHSRPERCGTYVIEVTEFNFDVKNDLRGHLASEDISSDMRY